MLELEWFGTSRLSCRYRSCRARMACIRGNLALSSRFCIRHGRLEEIGHRSSHDRYDEARR